MLGFCYGIANQRADAERVLEAMKEIQKQELAQHHYVSDQELGIIYLGLNDLDHAFPLLKKAVDEKFPPAQSIFIAPMFDRLRSDPRYADMAREVRLPWRPPTISGPASRSAK